MSRKVSPVMRTKTVRAPSEIRAKSKTRLAWRATKNTVQHKVEKKKRDQNDLNRCENTGKTSARWHLNLNGLASKRNKTKTIYLEIVSANFFLTSQLHDNLQPEIRIPYGTAPAIRRKLMKHLLATKIPNLTDKL